MFDIRSYVDYLKERHKHNGYFILFDDNLHITAVGRACLDADPSALKFDSPTFELESADHMAQYTIRTDLNPGVGPSADHAEPAELRALSRAWRTDFHGLQPTRSGRTVSNSAERLVESAVAVTGTHRTPPGDLGGTLGGRRTIPTGQRPPGGLGHD